jgi:GNAT superfamily N-acetyltransferase
MERRDIAAADRAYRLAFGTAFRLPEPLAFRGDGDVLGTRSATWPEASFVAEVDGRVVGSVTGVRWGSVVGLGPITVHPDHQRGGIARALLEAFMAVPAVRDARLTALFTFPDSPVHLRLYESLGFAPGHLTAVLGKPPVATSLSPRTRLFSELVPADAERALGGCREVAESVFQGLDLTQDILAVRAQHLGETLIIADTTGAVDGFAVCHAGPGTEATTGMAFVKFAAVRPGATACFATILAECEAWAANMGAKRIRAGVNTGRRDAYRAMKSHGFVVELLGIAMHRPDLAGWDGPGQFVIDDFR